MPHSATIRMPVRSAVFEAALEGLTRVNERLMSDPSIAGRTSFPPLYDAGVRYKHEPRDVWRHAGDVMLEGWGDCEDLSAYRAAELRVSGEDPAASVGIYQSGPSRYHAIVKRGDGSMEDPSKALGMNSGGSNTMPRLARHATIIGADPTPDDGITFDVVRIPGQGWGKGGGWRGVLRIPVGMQKAIFTAGPPASTPAAAIQAVAQQAATPGSSLQNQMIQTLASVIPGGQVAASILTNPVATDLLKKGAGAAVDAIKSLKFW